MSTLYARKDAAKGRVTYQNIEIFDFLNKHSAGVLGTVDANGDPHSSVVYYDTSPFFTIRFITKKDTRKAKNLSCNPRATFLVFDETQQITAQVSGTVSEITNEWTKNHIFRYTLRSSLHSSSNCIPPISRLDAGEYVAYELVALDVKMTTYK